LNYCNTIAQLQGSQLWAAQLSDDRYLPVLEERLDGDSDEPVRPSLLGETSLVSSLRLLTNQVLMLRAEQGKWPSVKPLKGPVYPFEKIAERRDKVEAETLLSVVDQAHANWEVDNDAGL
jgi:hypothetical protein